MTRMTVIRRTITTAVVGVLAIVGLPGAAYARTTPVGPASDSANTHAPSGSLFGWGLTTVFGVVVLMVLAAGLVLVTPRIARHRHSTRPTALEA
jgi:Mn2+/Fe2+ NRAMP family transporter